MGRLTHRDDVVDYGGRLPTADAVRVRQQVLSPKTAPVGVIASLPGARPIGVMPRLPRPLARCDQCTLLAGQVSLAAETTDARGMGWHHGT